MSFANKAVLVTGASSGIGAATAILFAKEGANVAMVGRNVTKLKNVAERVAQVGKAPLVIIADVSKDSDAKRIIYETVDKFSRLDVLVNNAGLVKYGNIVNGTLLDSYDGVFNINVRAVFHLTSLAAPHLIKTKGNIVNISSVVSLHVLPNPNFLAYSVSKAAVDHLTRGAAAELAAFGVRVNCINPGPVRTDFLENAGDNSSWESMAEVTALGRVSEPEDVADLIMYVAGDKALGITGSMLLIDNGKLLKN